MRTKKYCETSRKYEEKLRKAGYTVTYNWVDGYAGEYNDVTVRGPLFRGYGGEFSTTRKAWEYINRQS